VDSEEAAKTIQIILKPCLKCHVEVNHAIGRTSVARSVLPAALFTHKPHVREAGCLDCHGKIAASEEAADLSLDGVEKCRACHRSGGPSDSCRTCHRYHPPGVMGSLASAAPGAGGGGPS
jgi:predicted CXXCH cytochrome family protein